MRNVFQLAKAITAALVISNCFTPKSPLKSNEKKIKLLYFPTWTVDKAAKISTFIKQEKNQDSTIALIKYCQIFPPQERPCDTAKTIELIMKIFEHSNVDAILFSGDLLNVSNHITANTSTNKFLVLGANVLNKRSTRFFWQDYLINKICGVRIAILGVTFDTLNPTVNYRDPNFVIQKLLPIIKSRSDFQCLITNTNDTLDYPFNVILGAPSKNTFWINSFSDNIVYEISLTFNIENNLSSIVFKQIELDTIFEDPTISKFKNEIFNNDIK
ncbi:MAG: hypothetical protein ABIK10_04405 [candidate division WOR-3 bacterium]